MFQLFLMPLLLALVFAICSQPLMNKIPIKSHKMKSFLTTAIIAVLLIIPLFILISVGASESADFFKNLNILKYLNSDFLYQKSFVRDSLQFFSVDQKNFDKMLNQRLIEAKEIITISLQNFVYKIPIILFNFSVMITAIYFMLADGNKIKGLFYKNFIYDEKVGSVIVKTFVDSSWAIMIATLGSAIIQTFVVLIPSLFINLDRSILIAFAIFIFSMIPIIGTVPVIAILFFYHLSQAQYVYALLYFLLGFIIGFIDSIIRMIILQKRLKINPFVALLSSLVGIHVFGFFGLILGPIIIVTLLKLLLFTLKPEN